MNTYTFNNFCIPYKLLVVDLFDLVYEISFSSFYHSWLCLSYTILEFSTAIHQDKTIFYYTLFYLF